MTLDPRSYQTLVFDCDGVLLNSNRVKTEAFHAAAMPYGGEAANALVRFHTSHGGISRYRKFAHFLEHIVPGRPGPDLDVLLERYADLVRDGLMSCASAAGLERLRAHTPGVTWMVVSGGDQEELREVFVRRGMATLFDGGIHGSPDPKDLILARLQTTGVLTNPALFLGDSVYDHQVSAAAGLDFVFMHAWSEVTHWQRYVADHGLATAANIEELFGTGR